MSFFLKAFLVVSLCVPTQSKGNKFDIDWTSIVENAAKLRTAIDDKDGYLVRALSAKIMASTESRGTLYYAGLKIGEEGSLAIGKTAHYVGSEHSISYHGLTERLDATPVIKPKSRLTGITFLFSMSKIFIDEPLKANYYHLKLKGPKGFTRMFGGGPVDSVTPSDIAKKRNCVAALRFKEQHYDDIVAVKEDAYVLDESFFCPEKLSSTMQVSLVIGSRAQYLSNGKFVDVFVECGRIVYTTGQELSRDIAECSQEIKNHFLSLAGATRL